MPDTMIPLSILDLAPIAEGSNASTSFHNSLELARHGERLGYQRYWLAEHHGMPGIASAATAVVMAHVTAGTSTIRVGAGGIMLPNHAPLVIAEQFGTLEALHPGRIDLGLGRAPGSDQSTARALRRKLQADADQFPQDVLELQDYLSDTPRQRVLAVPGKGAKVPLWILGSSTFGAQLAAQLGLPFAFASHFAPQMLMQALDLYRANFRPSAQLEQPYVMLGFNVFAADSAEQAALLATSQQQSFVNLRTGHPSQLPPPRPDYLAQLGPHERAIIDSVMPCSAIGTPDQVAQQLHAFIARTGANELMINSPIFEHTARLHSYQLTAAIMGMTD